MSKKNRLRDVPVLFYVTNAEFNVINDKAKYCKLSRSAYLRKVSVNSFIVKRELDGIYEIGKIGININQIARKVNERGSVIESDVEELRVQYEKIFEVVYGQIFNG